MIARDPFPIGEQRMSYVIRYENALRSGPIPDLHQAKAEALGAMASRISLKSVEIVPIAPGMLGGVGSPILTAIRRMKGGRIRWQSH